MKYFGYYADKSRLDDANCTLAAVNKMNYIAGVIAKKAGSVEIISCAAKLHGPQKRERVVLGNSVSVQYFASKPRLNRAVRVLARQVGKLKFLAWVLKNVSRNETIIVYHSLGYMNEIYLARKLKKFRLVLEVEEIYADVIGNEKLRDREVQILRQADAYIFPTRLLSRVVNTAGKPEVIIHGSYQVEPDRTCKVPAETPQDGSGRVIHCVYAGTLDPRKGGTIAAAAAEFLPNRYHIHILGFGSDLDVRNVKAQIAEIASRSEAKVTYDGLLSGEDYIRFIQNCDIGLSTQNPYASFNATSFPSKILSYMANGLRVVSVRIPAVEQSDVGDMLYYYDEQTPEQIAGAIVRAGISRGYDGRKRIKELDSRFQADLEKILS